MDVTEWILKYWLEAGFGLAVFGCSAGFRYLKHKIKRTSQEQDAIKLGIQALLRDSIIHSYNKYMSLEYIPIHALENVEHMYVEYHNLGGNGTITNLMEKLRALPNRKDEEYEREI